jgi:hypothetical protein
MVMAFSVMSSAAIASGEVCKLAGVDPEDGSLQEDIRIESSDDVRAIAQRAASETYDWSLSRASLMKSALVNFTQAMQQAPDAETARVTGAFTTAFESWISDLASGGASAVSSEVFGPLSGSLGSYAKLLFGMHEALEKSVREAKAAQAKLALVDWVVSLNTQIESSYGQPPPRSKLAERLMESLESQHGELGDEPTIDQITWAAELCASVLELEQARADEQDRAKEAEKAEASLYQAWIRSGRDELRQSSCIELNYTAEADGSTLTLSQDRGRVRIPHFGPQLVRRLDQLIMSDAISDVTALEVPLCVCVDGLPSVLERKSCNRFTADRKFDRVEGDAAALGRIPNESYWREETTYIDPFEEESDD